MMYVYTLHRISLLIRIFFPLYRKITCTFLVPGPQISGPKRAVLVIAEQV